MPVRILGMIGVAPPQGNTLHVIAGAVSAPFLRTFAQAHEAAGFDEVLVGYYSSSAEGFTVASHAAAHTKTLRYLIAHRPGIVAPTLAARAAATFDHLSDGRLSLHIIAGVSDKEQESEGDFLTKDARYARAAEYLHVMRRLWTEAAPFDHAGDHYRINAGFTAVKPLQRPYPPLFFGGSSDGALAMGAEHCDVYALFGEPLKETAERIDDFRTRAAIHGKRPRFNISFRPHRGRGVGPGAAHPRRHGRLRHAGQGPGPQRRAPARTGGARRGARRAAVDGGGAGDRREGQHLLSGRHGGAGGRGDAALLPAGRRLLPDPRL
jgi:alkanesulfonate monooxygenase